MRKIAIVIVVIAAVGLAAFWAYRTWFASKAQAEQANWRIVTVNRGTIEATVSASGTIRAKKQVALSFKSAGRIARIAVEEGQAVRQGEVLAELDAEEIALQVRQAEVNLRIAEERAALARRQPTAEELAAAEAALRAARENLARLDAGPDPSQVASAKAALRAAEENLARLQAGPSEAQLAAAEASLRAAEASYKKLLAGPSADDLRRAKLAVDQAKNSLWGAQNARDSLGLSVQFGGPRSQYDQAQAQVLNAEIAVELAEINYRQLLAGPGEAEIEAARASVERAREAYLSLKEMPRSAELAAAEAQVAQARATLDRLLSGPTAAERAAAESQVAQAEAALARLRTGASQEELKIADAQVEQARLALEQARRALDGTKLIAPFDGVVAAVNLQEGALASAATPVLVLVDLSGFRIQVRVDEVDIALVREGQPVRLTLDALPGQEIRGQVARIAPISSLEGGINTYTVDIEIAPTDAPLRAGMSATAEITTERKEGVLLVPNRAIGVDRESGIYYVEKWEKGQLVTVEVTPGMRNEFESEIVSGLQEGDEVVIRNITFSERIRSRFGLGGS